MIIGAHIRGEDPLGEAAALGAECIQMFVGPPQAWRKPPPRPDAEQLRASPLPIYVHAPYLINVASPNNRVRIPSRKILTGTIERAEEIGAAGLIVHAGHAEDEVRRVFMRWRKVFEEVDSPVPILIENTAGGDNAMARELGAVARLWDAVGEFGAGFVLDTCHAWAAGWDLATAVDDVRAITGRVDLVHLNNSRDPHGSARDRHAPLTGGEIPLELLLEVARAADCPVVLETPGDAASHAEEVALVREALREA